MTGQGTMGKGEKKAEPILEKKDWLRLGGGGWAEE